MKNPTRATIPEQKLARIHLVARVQLAYEQVREAVRRYGSDPARRRRHKNRA